MSIENIHPDASLPEKSGEEVRIISYIREAVLRVIEPDEVENAVEVVRDLIRKTKSFHRPEFKQPYEREQIQYPFEYGRKKLTIKYFPGPDVWARLGAAIYNVSTDSERKPRETTLLYLAAHTQMQLLADQYQQALQYVFGTGNKNLQQWAETRL